VRTELTIAWLTARQLLTRRRRLPVLLLALLPVLLAGLFRLQGGSDATGFAISGNDQLILRIVLPIIALIFGTGAFGAERDEGTALYLLTKPIPRWRIALAKLVTAAGLTLAFVVSSTVAATVAALGGFGEHGLVPGFAAAAALGSVLYATVFVALGLFVRRALPIGLIYVVLWEVAAADMFAGTRTLSIRQYVNAAADRIITVDPAAFSAQLGGTTAAVMSVAVLVTACALAVYRLRSFQVVDQQ
jgi:ABC-2 type transport system permease protein